MTSSCCSCWQTTVMNLTGVCVCLCLCVCVCTRICARLCVHICGGLARAIYIRCIYGIFGRENTKGMVIYGVYIYTVLANPTYVCNT